MSVIPRTGLAFPPTFLERSAHLRERTVVPVVAAKRHFVMVDAFRVVCAAWVMWIHVPESATLSWTHEVAQFRMPFFTLLAVFFLFGKLSRDGGLTFGPYIQDRLRRLYLPFLGWTGIYYLLSGCLAESSGDAWPALQKGFLIHGGTWHLWFLPFILVVGVVTFPLARWILNRPSSWKWVVAVCVIAGVVVAAGAQWIQGALIRPGMAETESNLIGRSSVLFACLPFGVVFYLMFRKMRRVDERVKGRMSVWAMGVFAGLLLVDFFLTRPTMAWNVAGPLVGVLMAMSLMFVCVGLTVPVLPGLWQLMARMGRHSFGMYASHMVYVELIRHLRAELGIAATWQWDVMAFAVCVPASLATAVLLSRSRWTHWLVPTGDADARRLKAAEG